MNVKQLSLFMENKPGQLLVPCDVLAKAGINILLLALADTERFGILRIVVLDWQAAKAWTTLSWSRTTRMPRPPPPAAAFSISG